MSTVMGRLRRTVMGVSRAEATGFSRGDSPLWTHLENVVLTAVGGYHALLDGGSTAEVVARLNRTPWEMRSYAYEGAAMGLTGMDLFLPGRSRLAAYIAGPGAPHIYMVYIGAGEALARLRRRPEPFLARLADPVLRWLVMDGYGFHEGFFKPARHLDGQFVPTHLSPYARRVFDQGLGRSIWFGSGADADRIITRIGAFPEHRRADLWLGIGVACCYVGGVDRATVERLHEAAGEHAAPLAVGAAFVAKGRHRAGNPVADTDLACDVLCGGRTSVEAASVVDAAFAALPHHFTEPGYEVLQRGLLQVFAEPTPVTGSRS